MPPYLEHMERAWGTPEFARHEIRGMGRAWFEDDEGLISWLASYMRRPASPSAAIALER